MKTVIDLFDHGVFRCLVWSQQECIKCIPKAVRIEVRLHCDAVTHHRIDENVRITYTVLLYGDVRYAFGRNTFNPFVLRTLSCFEQGQNSQDGVCTVD